MCLTGCKEHPGAADSQHGHNMRADRGQKRTPRAVPGGHGAQPEIQTDDPRGSRLRDHNIEQDRRTAAEDFRHFLKYERLTERLDARATHINSP